MSAESFLTPKLAVFSFPDVLQLNWGYILNNLSGITMEGAPVPAVSAEVPKRAYITIAQKLEGAKAYKEAGTALFKDGNFKKAVIAYRKVLAFTRGLPGSKRVSGSGDAQDASMHNMIIDGQRRSGPEDQWVTDDEEEAALDIESQTLTNISTCYLRLEKGAQAQEAAKKALALRPYSWKAYLRMAESQLMCKEFDESKASYKRAWELAPESEIKTKNSIAFEINKIKQLKKDWEAELRSVTSNAFGKAFGAGGGPVGSDVHSEKTIVEGAPTVVGSASSTGRNNIASSSSSSGSTDLPPTAPAT